MVNYTPKNLTEMQKLFWETNIYQHESGNVQLLDGARNSGSAGDRKQSRLCIRWQQEKA